MKRIKASLQKSGWLTLFAFVVFALTQSCTQHEIIPPEAEYETFSTSIQPIFNADCLPCHRSGGIQEPFLSEGSAYVSLTSNGYIDTDNPEQSLLIEKLNESSHKSYTTSTNVELILEWIKAGAPND
jgi:hypothetical protein